MGCRIERAAGFVAGVLGCLCALQWLRSGIGGRASAAAALVLLASGVLAAGAYLHSSRGTRVALFAVWAASPVLLISGLAAGPAGLPLVLLAVFTPVLATLLQRRGLACEVPRPSGRILAERRSTGELAAAGSGRDATGNDLHADHSLTP